jgi:hypothetical protein
MPTSSIANPACMKKTRAPVACPSGSSAPTCSQSQQREQGWPL